MPNAHSAHYVIRAKLLEQLHDIFGIVSFWLIFVVISVLYSLLKAVETETFEAVVYLVIFGSLILWFALLISWRFKRARAVQTLLQAVREDERPPLLLLRSVSNPRLQGMGRYRTGDVSGGVADIKNDHDSIVNMISARLDATVSPVITFVPTSDYCSHYLEIDVPDHLWRHAVAFAARSCWGVLLFPEESASIVDEIRWITSGVHSTKVVVVVPPMTISSLRRNWMKLQERWARRGFHLPDYQEGGFAYTPNSDLSVNRLWPLDGSVQNIDKAVNGLLPAIDFLPLGTLVSYAADLLPRSAVPMPHDRIDQRLDRINECLGLFSDVRAEPDQMSILEKQHFCRYLQTIPDNELMALDESHAWIATHVKDSPRFAWYAEQTDSACKKRFGLSFQRRELDSDEIRHFN